MSVNIPVTPPGGTLFWCERAWLPTGVADRVLIGCSAAGLVTSVVSGVSAPPRATRLAGLALPGLANGHSHAFHRALRGRTHAGRGTFWTWREAMYRLAAVLDPERYYRLARLVYAEMALAGYVSVGEFHYLHHPPGGGRYAEPNAMGIALLEAAREAGVRITLLDTCYLVGGLDESGYHPLAGPQARFGDGDVEAWLSRLAALDAGVASGLAWAPAGEPTSSANVQLTTLEQVPLNAGTDPDGRLPRHHDRGLGGVPSNHGETARHVPPNHGETARHVPPNPGAEVTGVVPRKVGADPVGPALRVDDVPRGAADGPRRARVGAALHSVRGVPVEALSAVAAANRNGPTHVHLSEQPAENEACLAYHGRTPTQLLADAGLLARNLTAVHATHLTGADIALLGGAGVTACFCLSTEADLADGIGPARELADAGCPISLGSDQHAVVDSMAELRALEYGERLRSGRRGRFTPVELVRSATEHGQRSLGWSNGGRIEPGALCDLVAVRADTVRTAGALPEQLVLAASAADVHTVVVGGRLAVRGGVHLSFGTVGPELAEEIERLWDR